MISAIEVRDFQSLHHVNIELGRFTVIVGPSNVGKSAFMRAIRTLTSNRRGNDFISAWARTCSITAKTDKGTVTLSRSKGTTGNSYVVIPDGHPEQQETYSKLEGTTPPEVSQFLGIQSRDPINYAGQLDKPFMLDDTGSEVARALGALTNVNVLFEGARESNRRKLAAAQDLRSKSSELGSIKERIPQFTSIKAQQQSLGTADAHITKAVALQKRISRIQQAVAAVESAEESIAQWQTLLKADAPVLAVERVLKAQAALGNFQNAITIYAAARTAANTAWSALKDCNDALDTAEQEYAELVGSMGDDVAGWFAAVAEKYIYDGVQMVTMDEAVRVAALLIQTRAENGA